jgi:hypothetical protein
MEAGFLLEYSCIDLYHWSSGRYRQELQRQRGSNILCECLISL